jgi:RNA polymerase sigma-70 factor (ECF subfamily)
MSTETRNRPAQADDDEARFVDVYRRYGRHIQAYCARRTDGAQVADAVADTFLVAWRRIDQIPEGEAALLWLYAVAYRVLSHQWRHKARSRRLIQRLQGLADVDSFSPDVVLLKGEEHREVLLAAARLRPADQEILRLTLWGSCPMPTSPWFSGSPSLRSRSGPTGPVATSLPNSRSCRATANPPLPGEEVDREL